MADTELLRFLTWLTGDPAFEVDQRDELEAVDLAGRGPVILPDAIGQIRGLRLLYAVGNSLAVLPESLGWAKDLRELYVSNNRLGTLPQSIGLLTNLRLLEAVQNELTSLPDSVGQLRQMRRLDIGANRLSALPDSLFRLATLRELNAYNNCLTALPESFGQLKGLLEFNVFNNELAALPESLGQLTHLRRLDVGNNPLSALPGTLGRLTNLVELYAAGTLLTALPDSVGELANLERLEIPNNEIATLPESLCKLTNLRELNAQYNPLTELPKSLGRLENLQRLRVSGSKLTTLPDSLGELSSLQLLDAADNALSALPDTLDGLEQLRVLNLSNNRLTRIGHGLGLLVASSRALDTLFLHGNEGLGIPPELLGPTADQVYGAGNIGLTEERKLKPRNPKELAPYLRDLANGDVVPTNEVRLLVVGPGGHGKSSLIEYLRNRTFRPGRETTEGIDIAQWNVPGNGGQEIRVNVWDFGGQEIQHSTHEFFLSERSVYLLVFSPRDDQAASTGLYYWLDLIHLVAPEAPVIVALSKQDEGAHLINDAQDLKKLHPKLVDFVPVTCAPRPGTPDNRERLGTLIQETVRNLEHVSYRLPKRWMAAKQKLEKRGKDYLSYQGFVEICNDCLVSNPEEQRVLANLLNDLGTMLNYGRRLPLEETHILNPRWVTEGVYAVVLCKELSARKGVLDEALLAEQLSASRHAAKYPGQAQRFILQMMLSFKLAYPLGSRNGVMEYLVPNALPHQESDGNHVIADALRFEIYFPRILPTSLMSRFIVAMHGKATVQSMWRLGIYGRLQGHEFLVTAHPKERRVRIAVGGVGRTRVSVLDQIRAEWHVICREREGLVREERTFPPGKPEAEPYSFQALLEAEKKGVQSIWLPNDVGDVNVREWLDGVTDAAARARAQAAAGEPGRPHVQVFNEVKVMRDDRSIHATTITGSRLATGDHANLGDQTQLNGGNTAELLKVLQELRRVITEARGQGASVDDCDVAEDAISKLEAAVQRPKEPAAKKEAKGALAMLKGTASGLTSLATIGTKFHAVLNQIEPLMVKAFEWTMR